MLSITALSNKVSGLAQHNQPIPRLQLKILPARRIQEQMPAAGICGSTKNSKRHFTLSCQHLFQHMEVGTRWQRIVIRIAEPDFTAAYCKQLVQYRSEFPAQSHLRQNVAEYHRADEHLTLVTVQQLAIV